MITIDYFSDVLCVWAYAGQIRLDELQQEFAGEILVRQRFLGLFADTGTRIGEAWQEKGGFDGFGAHMQELATRWEHVKLHQGVWTDCRPTSSTTSHVFLKAASLCLGLEHADADADPDARSRLDRLVAGVRTAFFEEARDVSRLSVLTDLLGAVGLSVSSVEAMIDNGEAYAALHRDGQLAKQHGVLGSPTYVFNEGRQLLYGNVGYRIIASNLRELMSSVHVEGEPSWC